MEFSGLGSPGSPCSPGRPGGPGSNLNATFGAGGNLKASVPSRPLPDPAVFPAPPPAGVLPQLPTLPHAGVTWLTLIHQDNNLLGKKDVAIYCKNKKCETNQEFWKCVQIVVWIFKKLNSLPRTPCR